MQKRLFRPVVSPWRRGNALAALAALFVLQPVAAAAQTFGQWTWEGLLGLGQRRYGIRSSEAAESRSAEQDLRLSLGLHGFIVHPALARFHLGADLIATQFEAERELDSDRLGFRGDLHLFPTGAYTGRLFVQRQAVDYSGDASSDPLILAAAPETSTSWGGRAWLKRGRLRGTLLSFERSSLEFQDPATRPDSQQHELIDWSRSGEGLRQHLRLDHRDRKFGVVDLEIDDFTLNFEESGDIAPGWGWQATGTGIDRSVALARGGTLDSSSFSLRNRLTHPLRGTDVLDVSHSVASSQTESSPSLLVNEISVLYRRHLRDGLELAPFVELGHRTSRDFDELSPRAGMQLAWSRRRGPLDSLVNGRIHYGFLRRSTSRNSFDQDFLGFSLTGTVGHGQASGWRQELEAGLSRSEFRLDRELFLDFPDLGLPLDPSGTEDEARARLSLSHHRQTRAFHVFGEWAVRDSSRELRSRSFRAETLTANFQFSLSSFGLQAGAGETSTREERFGEQAVRFIALTTTWRLRRWVSFRGSYRSDVRRFALTPDIDGERLEAGLDISFGLLTLEGRAFEAEEHLVEGMERTNRGLTWVLNRRFGGLLPIVTGEQRRGVIR